MKIRCEQDSIRLRLRKSEITQLRNEGWLRTSVRLPGNKELGWELAIAEQSTNLHADFSADTLRITLPTDAAHHWIDTEQVGLEMHLALEGGGRLHVLAEKDFPCKDRPGEDTTDFFHELAETTPPAC